MTYEAEHKFDEESDDVSTEHACKECDRKFSKLSKLIKHITKKHLKVDEETEDKDLSDSGIIVEKDEAVSDEAQESIQDYSFEPPEDDGNDFVDGDPWTCALCGLTMERKSEIAHHMFVLCGPEESNWTFRNSVVFLEEF